MLDIIRTFVQVVENRSFQTAANRLSISPSVVTRRIANLEEQMKAKLIQRTTRQLRLTEAGFVFYESCQEILRAFDSSKESIHTLNNALYGTLKIGLPMSICHIHLSNIIQSFVADHPGLKIHIVSGNHLMDLLKEGFDLVIHCGKLPDSSFYSKKLGTWQQIYCASPAYLEKFGTPSHPEELQRYNCLDHYDNFQHSWQFTIDEKVKELSVDGSIIASSSINLRNLALQDLGIACLPSFTVIKKLNSKKLVSILSNYAAPEIDISVVYASKKYQPQKVDQFIKFLQTWAESDSSGINTNFV